MSYLQRKSNWADGVRNFLTKQGFDVSGRGHKANKIMVMFLKEYKLSYEKWNFNYKGLNTAELINSEIIQEHWSEFAY